MKSKPKTDNRSLREQSTKELLQAVMASTGNLFTTNEKIILEEVLINHKSFGEIGETILLTRSRQRTIFKNGLVRLKRYFSSIEHMPEIFYAKEKELKEAKEKLSAYEREQEKQKNISPELKELLAQSISEIGFSVRLLNSLHGRDINTVADLVRSAPGDLFMLRNFGKKSMDEVVEFFKKHGLSFRMDV